MRADAAGKHDARLELAVLSGDGKCVTRGRVETIDDDDDERRRRGGLGGLENGEDGCRDAPPRGGRNRGARLVVSAPPRASLDRPRRGRRRVAGEARAARARGCGAARTRTRFLLPSDGADVALVMGARRAAWVRFPAGAARAPDRRGESRGRRQARRARRRAVLQNRLAESSFRSPLFSVSESHPESRRERRERRAQSATREKRLPGDAPRRRGDALVHARGRGARPPRAQPLVGFARDVEALPVARRRRAGALRDSERRGPGASARRLARRQRARGVGRTRARSCCPAPSCLSSWTRPRGTLTRPRGYAGAAPRTSWRTCPRGTSARSRSSRDSRAMTPPGPPPRSTSRAGAASSCGTRRRARGGTSR